VESKPASDPAEDLGVRIATHMLLLRAGDASNFICDTSGDLAQIGILSFGACVNSFFKHGFAREQR
jgi:hypothetical protein